MQEYRFCPNKECKYHHTAPDTSWYVASGFYTTKCFGRVPRYRCRACGRFFSRQTFSLDYYAKKRLSFSDLEILVSSSMSIRALSRFFHVSCGTIQNRIDRLSRQAIAVHHLLRPLRTLHEPICIDGFVSFDRSQYFPNNITLAVTSDSQFILGLSHATLRRSGRMTAAQKRTRARLDTCYQFERHALERSFSELLQRLEKEHHFSPTTPLILITDEKKEYRRALSAYPAFRTLDAAHWIIHKTVSSLLPRTRDNPLFASNYTDRELRKDQAAHRRETVCFARNVANMLNRLCVYILWHNYNKPYRIKAGTLQQTTHAAAAGIAPSHIRHALQWMLSERAFVTRLALDSLDIKLWYRQFPTPLKKKPEYLPAYARA